MYKSILKNAFKPLELNESLHPEFFEVWQERSFERNELITEAGKIEKSFFVVVDGVQCIYIITPKGDKKVIGFSFNGSFSGVYDSFLKNKPSAYFLEALTPTKMLSITKKDYDRFFELYPEFNYWGRIVHQELLIGRVNREIELITLSAKERYDKFMKRCPSFLLDIPQKYLASYLNMTQETFSRLRKSIS
ncbi:MAG: Crp/Fnr family transcriptional regulator [Crocinitomicaceae bacterium]